MSFLDERVLPYNISRKESDIEITPSELKILLSKINEKYRNNFSEYL